MLKQRLLFLAVVVILLSTAAAINLLATLKWKGDEAIEKNGQIHSTKGDAQIDLDLVYRKRDSHWDVDTNALTKHFVNDVSPSMTEFVNDELSPLDGAIQPLSQDHIEAVSNEKEGTVEVSLTLRPQSVDRFRDLADISDPIRDLLQKSLDAWAEDQEKQWRTERSLPELQIEGFDVIPHQDEKPLGKLAVIYTLQRPNPQEEVPEVEKRANSYSKLFVADRVEEIRISAQIDSLPSKGKVWRIVDLSRSKGDVPVELEVRVIQKEKKTRILRTQKTASVP